MATCKLNRIHLLKYSFLTFVVCIMALSNGYAEEDSQEPVTENDRDIVSIDDKKVHSDSEASAVQPQLGISSNPAAANIISGTGDLGRYIGINEESGVRVGGMWITDTNKIIAGGLKHGKWRENSLFLLNLTLDTEKMSLWDGGMGGVEFLQFNGFNANERAGAVQGYNGLPGPKPLNRSELYQIWYRQSFFRDKFVVRVGKTVPIYDFNNVLRPVPMKDPSLAIPAVSGLIYTPIFVNTTMIGVMPGYYNSAYGITTTLSPTKSTYLSYGAYDGNLARGKQTGLHGPHFNGNYFQTAEAGYAWNAGKYEKPGMIAVGAWRQRSKGMSMTVMNKLGLPTVISERNPHGVYAFGSQRLWLANPGKDNSGISGFFQFGKNHSKTLPMNKYLGLGLTAFGLVPHRQNDSMGFGVANSWLNQRSFVRKKEHMYQGYYQMYLFKNTYLQPVITYIPRPGADPKIHRTWIVTMRLTFLF
jgi:porin